MLQSISLFVVKSERNNEGRLSQRNDSKLKNCGNKKKIYTHRHTYIYICRVKVVAVVAEWRRLEKAGNRRELKVEGRRQREEKIG